MSEIINNRRQRVEIMKSLIRQLHSGETEERVKSQLETMLDEADYSDVFLMEVQLVQEGIPAESIQKLCDTHTRVLKKHLDLQETPETIPGHPVHTFVQENRELVRDDGAGPPADAPDGGAARRAGRDRRPCAMSRDCSTT